MLILTLLLVLFATPDKTVTGTLATDDTGYRCPPCGCIHDKETFNDPGICPTCDMPLVAVKTGFLGSIDQRITPLLSDNPVNNLYYTKIIYPAIILGLLIGLALLLKLIFHQGNVFLTLFILSLSLYGFKYQLTGVSYAWSCDLECQFLPLSYILLLGPSIYFYVQSAVNKSFKFTPGNLWHFAPAILFLGMYITSSLSPAIRSMWQLTPFESGFSLAEQSLAVIGGMIYIFFSFRQFNQDNLNGSYEYRSESVRWLKILLTGLMVVLSVWAALLLANGMIYSWGVTTITYYPLWIVMAVYLYTISYYIIFKSDAFYISGFALAQRDSNRGLSKHQIIAYTNRLKWLMNHEKVYLDTNLNLQSLADVLEINPKKLSVVLKKGLETNFFDFVNSYRVREVKEQLIDPKNKHLTNLAIAYNAGFQSKSSFNAIFKKHEGVTPKEYKKEAMSGGNGLMLSTKVAN